MSVQGAAKLTDVDARCNRLHSPKDVVARKGALPCLARLDLSANAVAAHPLYRYCIGSYL